MILICEEKKYICGHFQQCIKNTALKRGSLEFEFSKVWVSESVQQIPATFSISDRKLRIHTAATLPKETLLGKC